MFPAVKTRRIITPGSTKIHYLNFLAFPHPSQGSRPASIVTPSASCFASGNHWLGDFMRGGHCSERFHNKFASLPWLGETGAFFGNVDRFEAGVGFFGAAEPSRGRPLDNGWKL